MRCDAYNEVIVCDALCLGHCCFYTTDGRQKIGRKIAHHRLVLSWIVYDWWARHHHRAHVEEQRERDTWGKVWVWVWAYVCAWYSLKSSSILLHILTCVAMPIHSCLVYESSWCAGVSWVIHIYLCLNKAWYYLSFLFPNFFLTASTIIYINYVVSDDYFVDAPGYYFFSICDLCFTSYLYIIMCPNIFSVEYIRHCA